MPHPYAVVGLSALTYFASYAVTKTTTSSDPSTITKLISGAHSLVSSAATIYILSQPWSSGTLENLPFRIGPQGLDDTHNPLITGRSAFGNALTAWETGYLIFDTVAILALSGVSRPLRQPGRNHTNTTRKAEASDTVLLGHHAALVAALGYLQTYIAQGRERGVWIIDAFILMNASTPFLHLRWWRRKRTGRAEWQWDALLAFTFALARFGSVVWVLRRYGEFHGLGAWRAMRMQRWVCQMGTGALVGLNGLWWLGLVRSMVLKQGKRAVKRE
ncbi:hypothetical protein MBLNU230_g8000t1 [Neophaeotheca triangularis]